MDKIERLLYLAIIGMMVVLLAIVIPLVSPFILLGWIFEGVIKR